jgi:hypothetical protein
MNIMLRRALPSSLLKKAFRQPEPSKTAVFLEVDSSENGLFNRLLARLLFCKCSSKAPDP